MSAALVALFAPYCQGATRLATLEQALELLRRRELRGQRRLRPAGERPFQLRWQAGVAPLEPAEVVLEVLPAAQPGPEDQAAVYAFTLPTHRLVHWLMAWLEAGGGPHQPADLPDSFWQWLILGIEPAAART